MSDPTLVVEVPSLLRTASGGAAKIEVSGATLRAALEHLFQLHPRLKPHLFDEAGELRPHINLFLREQNVRWLPGYDEAIRDGDTLLILQAVSGG